MAAAINRSLHHSQEHKDMAQLLWDKLKKFEAARKKNLEVCHAKTQEVDLKIRQVRLSTVLCSVGTTSADNKIQICDERDHIGREESHAAKSSDSTSNNTPHDLPAPRVAVSPAVPAVLSSRPLPREQEE